MGEEPAGAGAGQEERWAIVLAGGDGTRLRPLTRLLHGDDRPKQFCRVLDGRTLLEATWDRVALGVEPQRVLTVFTRRHERFYAPLAARLDPSSVVVQPDGRGTAPGILYPLARLAALAPDALVGVFPSDHHFSDDGRLMDHVDAAFLAARLEPGRVVLLGIHPDTHETEYGWIEPGPPLAARPAGRRLHPVRRFWEKPEPDLAAALRERGGLWNSFIMVAAVRGLLALVRSALPDLARVFDVLVPDLGTPREARAAERLYARLPAADFSRLVLAERPRALAVLPVSGVAWSDLGSPDRALRVRATIGSPALDPVPA